MQVITVLTEIDQNVFREYLEPSCKHYDLDLTVLEYEENYFSHRLKDALLNEYLKQIPEDEIIFFTDGQDTAFLTDEDEILAKYSKFNSPLVFSAEINCWPDQGLLESYPEVNEQTPNKPVYFVIWKLTPNCNNTAIFLPVRNCLNLCNYSVLQK